MTEDVAHVTASPIRRRTSGLALDWRVSSRAEPLHRRPHWFDLARALFCLRVSAAVADGEVCRSGTVVMILSLGVSEMVDTGTAVVERTG